MFTNYVIEVMSKLAQYELLSKEKIFFGSIRGFKGVWAQGKTLQDCEHNLQEVLEEWLLLKIRKKHFIPTTRKYDLNTLLGA